MVKIDRITTRGGDGGETSLGDGQRVPKDSPTIEAIGTVDELNATLGLLRALLPSGLRGDAKLAVEAQDLMIERIQNDLFDLGADLCIPDNDTSKSQRALRISEKQVERLEAECAEMTAKLAPLTSFVLPGGSVAAAQAHVARTVARRAERAVVSLMRAGYAKRPTTIYLNRLSDHLFALSRTLNDHGRTDILWQPGKHHAG